MIHLIDVLILVAALIGIANGYRRGFWLSLAQYVGLTVGVLLGAASARYVLDYLQINNSSARPLGAVLVLVNHFLGVTSLFARVHDVPPTEIAVTLVLGVLYVLGVIGTFVHHARLRSPAA